MRNQCEHGQLARVCERCEDKAEIGRLRMERDALQAEIDAIHATGGTSYARLRQAEDPATFEAWQQEVMRLADQYADALSLDFEEKAGSARAALKAKLGERP